MKSYKFLILEILAIIKTKDDVQAKKNSVISNDLNSMRREDKITIITEPAEYDLGFYELYSRYKMPGTNVCKLVTVGGNVFIEWRCMALKGMNVAGNSVITSSSIATNSLQVNCIAGDVPARVIKSLG